MEDPLTMSAWLETTDGKRIPVEGNCSFGRSRNSTVVLPDDKVSRRHAMIHSEEDSVYLLVDLGSANGTYVNGRRVTQACRLSEADQIQIGDNLFQFHSPNDSTGWDTDKSTEPTIENVRLVKCWLLLADIASSTKLATDLPTEEGARVTGLWLADCRRIVDSNGGAINKYLGDGFFAYWTDNQSNKAPAIAKAIKEFKELQNESPLQFRLVLHYGSVSIRGGAHSNGEDSLYGKDVHFAFRMEKRAGTSGIMCMMSEPAKNLLSAHIPVTPCGEMPLASFQGEFPFYSF